MTVTVLLFASWAEAFGRDRVILDVPDGATVAELRQALGVQAAAVTGRILPPVAVAVNQRWARGAERIGAGDEVAIIPPVAGG